MAETGDAARSIIDRPSDFLAREERHDGGGARIDPRRNSPSRAAQGDVLLVRRQAIETRTVESGEGFEAVERVLLGEDLGINLQGRRCRENPGAAARTFLV